jgi:hypothetical protein
VAHLPGQLNSAEFHDSPPAFSFVRVFSDACTSCSACWRQELERRARERYAVLDCLDTDSRWYRGQYEALEALVEALRSPDRWLAYRAEALLDSPPEQGAQAAEGASAVVRVRTVLVERDDALRRAHVDLENARSLASTWEAEVATAWAQLQQGRAALQEAEGLYRSLGSTAPGGLYRCGCNCICTRLLVSTSTIGSFLHLTMRKEKIRSQKDVKLMVKPPQP